MHLHRSRILEVLGALALVAGSSAPAFAEDVIGKQREATRRLFDAQLAALDKRDGKGFAATFITDAPAVKLPGRAPSTTAEDLVAVPSWLPTGAKLALDGEPVIGLGSNASWITADLTLTVGGKTEKLRLTELVVGLYEYKAKAAAMMVSRPIEDKQLVGATTAPAASSADRATLAARLTSPKLLLRELERPRGEVAVIGTSAAEKGIGAAAEKLLGRWQGLKLTLIGTAIEHEDDQMMAYALGQVSMARGKQKPVILDVLVIGTHDIRQDGARVWHISSVHYAAHVQP